MKGLHLPYKVYQITAAGQKLLVAAFLILVDAYEYKNLHYNTKMIIKTERKKENENIQM